MSTPLDRYTSAYLLSAYSFNDYRLKSAPSLDFEDGLDASKFAHSRDSNLGLGGGGKSFNDLVLGDTSLHDVTAANANPGLWLEECHNGRFIHRSIAALKPTSVDGAVLGLGEDLNKAPSIAKASSIADAIPVSRLHSKAGFDIISHDLINSLNDKRTPFSRPGVLQASEHVLPSCNAQSGHSLGSSLAVSPSFANVPLSDSIMVEVGSDCLLVPLEYERLPDFCTACKTISHVVSAYRHVKSTTATFDGEMKECGRSRSRKRVYRPIMKSPKITKIPIKNAFSALKKDLAAEPKNKEVERRDKQKLWVDEEDIDNAEVDVVHVVNEDVHVGNADVTNDEDDVANVDFGNTLSQNNASSSQPGVDVHVEIHSTAFAQQPNPSAESKNDCLNTSDLSPLKVFDFKDEGWQEVQSKKKKKAALIQAQYSSFIYASYDYLVRRDLWDSLSSLHVNGPWLALGDFNSIMGVHETTGIIKRRSCEDFRAGVTLCNLIDLDTQGPRHTWHGSRGGRIVFGDLKRNISKATEQVNVIQERLSVEGVFDDLLRQESDALSSLDNFLLQEETYLRE
ncbi:Zinc knuckle CX2CX4HX4C [Parasponia andersonii]|uniref:Zinc knuckle CX2CX4HX4C n=1 Tax=Parasponia andersonii TaxID=3476 RepID=A0A2P5DC72_PARAD|nr:Zinc knuckle CX2CX4HX4C [Parasponia andersonii]